MNIRVGELLAAKYRVTRVLSESASSMLFVAEHVQLSQAVTVRVTRREVPESETARFMRDARKAAQLRIRGAARIFDIGRLTNGSVYVAMEYVEGIDLAELARRTPLTTEQAVDFVIEACVIFAEAHSREIRCFLKTNRLITLRANDHHPSLKIVGLGLRPARRGDNLGEDDTYNDYDPSEYVAPEDWSRNASPDLRADIWTLGVILHELITGRLPFERTGGELVHEIAQDSPALSAWATSKAPAELRDIVASCLRLYPGARPSTVAALAGALRQYASPRGQRLVDEILSKFGDVVSTGRFPPAPGPPESRSASAAPRETSPAHRIVGFPLSLVLGALALVAYTSYVLIAGHSANRQPSPTDASALHR